MKPTFVVICQKIITKTKQKSAVKINTVLYSFTATIY